RAAGQSGAMGAGRGRQRRTLDMAEEHAGPLEEPAALEVARQSAAAFGPGPGVAPEGAALQRLEGVHDAGLQVDEEVMDAGRGDGHGYPWVQGRGAGRARQPMSRRKWRPSKTVCDTAS